MQQRDYLIRLIEEAARLLARSIGLVEQGQAAEAEQELSQAFQTHHGLPLSAVLQLEVASACELISEERREATATLLEGLFYALHGRDEARAEQAYRLARALRERKVATSPYRGSG